MQKIYELARTALLERKGCFGGNITQVGVEGFAWYRHEKTVDCEGIGFQRDEAFDALNIGAVQSELARQGARFR